MQTREKQNENLKADIVVIGSGGGLAAAVTAAEAGASIILLERESLLGGYTRMANGLMACDSPVQKRQKVTVTADALFKILMNWNHWGRVNPRVVRAYLNQSGETIAWLEGKGVTFDLPHLSPDMLRMAHMPVGMGAAVQLALIKSVKELGVGVFLNTSGKKIIRKPNGGVTGVVAVTKEGEEFQIATKAVVIATGGFGYNRELLKKYCFDYYDDMHIDQWPHREAHSGDGLMMAEEIGADIARSIPNYHLGPYYPGFMAPYLSISAMALNYYTIWVNKRGQRFINEPGNRSGGNAIMWQPGRVMYSIFDDELRKDVEEGRALVGRTTTGKHSNASTDGGTIEVTAEKGFPGLKRDLLKQAEKGGTKIADTWDEIAEWIGARSEALKAEINEYNSFCEKGYDAIFNRDKAYLRPLRKPPFYAMRCYARVGETMGGIIVNERMEVLNKEGDAIPGAYVGCVLADGFHGFDSCGEMGGSVMGFAVNSGRIAGKNAAKYVLKK